MHYAVPTRIILTFASNISRIMQHNFPILSAGVIIIIQSK